MKEESLLLLSDLQKLINQVVLIDYTIIILGGVMLVSFAEEKTGECVVCCHRCGAFLMELASTTSYMVCPECGVSLVVCVKKGKV